MVSAERQQLYDKYRDELLKRQLSNEDSFDRATLTLSTAALTFSLSFLRAKAVKQNIYSC